MANNLQNNEEYTNMHRGFLQACANLGAMKLDKAKAVFQAHWSKFNDTQALETDLQKAVELINKQLHTIEQKISFITSFWDAKQYVVLINTSATSMSTIQVIYTESEVHFFRMLQRDIVQSPDCSIRSINALNLTNALATSTAKLTKNRAQELIEIWCDQGYYIETEEMLTFGPKTQGEFGHFLKTSFPNDVSVCSLCKLSIFKGISCDHDGCESVLHKHCLEKFLAKNPNCPDCKNVWQVPLQ